jgi:hypothetical protein
MLRGAQALMASLLCFTRKFWHVIKKDFMDMIKGFEQGKINISRINYAIIILIPKDDEARTLKKYRPIS